MMSVAVLVYCERVPERSLSVRDCSSSSRALGAGNEVCSSCCVVCLIGIEQSQDALQEPLNVQRCQQGT